MSWERYDDSGERWSWTGDEERHLLFFDTASGELREYHEVPGGAPTVHVYTSRGPVVLPTPLQHAEHLRTMDVAPEDADRLRTLNDSKVFEYLEIGKSW